MDEYTSEVRKKIIDPTSSFHGNTLDILIRKGIIDNIGKNISAPKATIISHQNLCVSPGWFDSSVSFGEPGYEERETLSHGLQVAAAAGFTHIGYNTNTNPYPSPKQIYLFCSEVLPTPP